MREERDAKMLWADLTRFTELGLNIRKVQKEIIELQYNLDWAQVLPLGIEERTPSEQRCCEWNEERLKKLLESARERERTLIARIVALSAARASERVALGSA